jgi:hypothetical protein
MRNERRCTLDPGLTALALRGVTKPASYLFVEPLAEAGGRPIRRAQVHGRYAPAKRAAPLT